MARALPVAVLGLAVLAGAAALLLSRRGGDGPIGGGGPDDAAGGKAPAAVGAGAREGGAPSGARPASDGRLAGALRPERAGRGTVVARVLRARGEAPVEGAVVALAGTGYAGEAVEATGTTDAKGAVTVDGVPAARALALVVSAADLPARRVEGVEVRAGRTTDVGTLLLGSTSAVTGRVVDEKGAGVGGAEVRALVAFENPLEMLTNLMDLFTSMGREPTPLAKATSLADGSFRLEDVPAGTVLVRADAPGREAAMVKVRVAADGPVGEPPVLRLVAGARVAGVVVEKGGGPVAGATVALFSTAGGEPSEFLAGRVFATTDGAGRFEATVGAEDRKLRTVVEAEGFPTTFGAQVAPGATDVRIVLERGALVEATVLVEGSGEPVAGATVALAVGEGLLSDRADAGGAMPYGVTDAQGVARIPARPGSVEMLVLNHPSYGLAMLAPGGKSQLGNAKGDVPKAIPADGTTRFTVHLQPTVVVTGRVVSKLGGAPVVGAEVSVVSLFGGAAPKVRTDEAGAFRLAVPSAGSPFGGTMLRVVAPGFVPGNENVTVDDAARRAGTVEVSVSLAPGARVRGKVVAPDGTPVAGAKVTLLADVRSFDVAAFFAPGGGGVFTGADGTFLLADVGPVEGPREADDGEATARTPTPRRLRGAAVRVEAEGYVVGTSARFAIPEGGEVTVPPVRMSRGAVLSGVVRDPGGRAAAGAVVEVDVRSPEGEDPTDVGAMMASATRGPRRVTADADGRFSADRLPPRATVTLTASAAGTASSRRAVTVPESGDPPAVEIALRASATIAGTVLDGDGAPVAKATVLVDGGLVGVEGDDGFVPSRSATTDASGRFALEGLPAGTVRVLVTAAGHRGSRAEVATGTTATLRLEKRSASDAARLRELDAELAEIGQKFMAAKDEAERNALVARVQQLQTERQALQGAGGDDGPGEDVPEPPEAVEVPSR